MEHPACRVIVAGSVGLDPCYGSVSSASSLPLSTNTRKNSLSRLLVLVFKPGQSVVIALLGPFQNVSGRYRRDRWTH